jgi:glycosyltransferase involved in cell wall biosynthesis
MVHDCSFVGYELSEAINSTFNDIHVGMLPYPLHTKLTVFEIAQKIRKMNPEIVHAHYCRYPAYAALLSHKPYIIHCHGTDIRHGINFWQRLCLAKSRQVLVSTPDLLEILPDAVWLPNPVNLSCFRPSTEHKGNRVLYFPKWYENIENELDTACKQLGYSLTVKRKTDVKYADMPDFLNQFDIYVDRFTIKSYSKTALEAMACDLTVIGYEHNLKKALENLRDAKKRKRSLSEQRKMLSNHDRTKVASSLVKIYRQVYEK